MYSTCIFCQGKLGTNAAVEHFPLGRRLAFDAAKGRLWVVCGRCARWNLSPLEERWEAIEECERLFRETRLRTSTDHIGLARVKEGLELVRIGAPQRPEFAAWRYGPQLVRRLNSGVIVGAGAIAAGAALSFAVSGLGVVWLLVGAGTVANLPAYRQLLRSRRTMARVSLADGRILRINGWYSGSARLRRSTVNDGMELRLLHEDGDTSVTGSEILPALARLLAATNANGATPVQVARAVGALEAERGPEGFIDAVSRRANWVPADASDRLQMRLKPGHAKRWVTNPPAIARMPLVDRLALEMAVNEERERMALEGELHELEQEWRQAEEIAGIADDLLLPPGIAARLTRLRDGASSDDSGPLS